MRVEFTHFGGTERENETKTSHTVPYGTLIPVGKHLIDHPNSPTTFNDIIWIAVGPNLDLFIAAI